MVQSAWRYNVSKVLSIVVVKCRTSVYERIRLRILSCVHLALAQSMGRSNSPFSISVSSIPFFSMPVFSVPVFSVSMMATGPADWAQVLFLCVCCEACPREPSTCVTL